ncbi:MAG: ATP-binding protein [Methanoregulaceae archaeon]
MFTVDRLEGVVLDQEEAFRRRDPGIPREVDLDRYLSTAHIIVISGIRRCGKSTLLRQFGERIGDYLYINLDDERLFGFDIGDFEHLMLTFHKLHPGNRVLLIDEVQNVSSWERFVRRVHDDGYKVILTGSNAALLSGELATRLTGRYLQIELFPFSFREYLSLKGVDHARLTTGEKASLLNHFDYYLENGGFPEFLKTGDNELLRRTYEDILFRDIVARFGIRDVKMFRQMARYLFSNFTKDASYHSLKNALGIKSAMSVRSYVQYLGEAYLVFELFNYSPSLKKQYAGTKKFYVADNGIRNAVSLRFSGDWRRMLENLVFLELRRRGEVCYFWREKLECDFLIEKKGRLVAALQCSCTIGEENRKRELSGLSAAMDRWDIGTGTIITYNQEGEVQLPEGRTANLVPAWKWLTGTDPRD